MTHIWVPKAKIIEPKKALSLPVRVCGRFKLDVYRPDGRLRKSTGWFDNLITDAGLNHIGTNGTWMSACGVGTGTATPAVTDTVLANQVGSRTGTEQALSGGTTAPLYGWSRKTYRFGVGQATGNLTEIGIFQQVAAGGTMWSRALILDGSGNPTTLTVLSDEFLDATYEIRVMAPQVDVPDTLTITGVGLLDVNLRAAGVTGSNWSPAGGFGGGSVAGVKSGVLWTGALGVITAFPSGTSVGGSLVEAAYGNNNLYREGTVTWALNQANMTIRSTSWQLGATTGAGGFGFMQAEFTPTFAKNSAQILSLVYRHTWARGTP